MKCFSLVLMGGLWLGVASRSYGQSIVYDNTTTSLNNNFPLLPELYTQSAEAGDEIWLGGTDRQAVGLKLIFFNRGAAGSSFDARLRFRAYDTAFQGPGEVFYEQSVTSMWASPGYSDLDFALPNVMVPDRFVWTIELSNRQGGMEELGMAYFNPATVGFSDDFLWQRGGDQWTAYSWGADPYANFGARLTAVPEPSTLAVASLGLLWLKGRRKRKAS